MGPRGLGQLVDQGHDIQPRQIDFTRMRQLQQVRQPALIDVEDNDRFAIGQRPAEQVGLFRHASDRSDRRNVRVG